LLERIFVSFVSKQAWRKGDCPEIRVVEGSLCKKPESWNERKEETKSIGTSVGMSISVDICEAGQ
jgi:hypothetical protein